MNKKQMRTSGIVSFVIMVALLVVLVALIAL